MRLFFAFFTGILFLTSGRLPAQADFPSGWSGVWLGELEIFDAGGKVQSLPMQLHILPVEGSDRYSWLIIYGPDEPANRRSYELVVVDAEAGRYRIDEKNSIELEAYLLGDKLFSRFEVMGNLLLSTYEKRAEDLVFEVISGNREPATITGGITLHKDQIPEVRSFPVGIRQRAVLHRSGTGQ